MAEDEPLDALNPRQSKALEALLAESSIGKAAVASEVPERTLRHWLRDDPAFTAAYREARRESVRQSVARLQQASGAAVTVLLSLMANKNTAAPVRLAAAVKVLEMSHKAVELDDVIARIEALEAAHAQRP
jgi:hypothetical protein